MDGSLSQPSAQVQAPGKDNLQGVSAAKKTPPVKISGDYQYATNVLRLARSVKRTGHGSCGEQIVFYQSGVGSEADFQGELVDGTTLLKIAGTAVASKIRDAYVFIAQNYEEGDQICLFGFSRGAYTARKLSGLIDKIGLLTRQNLSLFFEVWLDLSNGKSPDDILPSDTRRNVPIECVGVWDTVGSVFDEINALSIKDKSLPATVKVALHALSIHENREEFLPTLWKTPPGGKLGAQQTLKQIWFGGAHSDVGGGYERHELADISLFWMAGEIKDLVHLDLQFLQQYSQPGADPWGASQPHNAYEEASYPEEFAAGHETRLEKNLIAQETTFHESVKHSPLTLTDPTYMITMDTIKNKLGRSSFNPDYVPLNEFEKLCRQHWGGQPRAPRKRIENPLLVVRPDLVPRPENP